MRSELARLMDDGSHRAACARLYSCVARGPLEFVCNALEFENLPIGNSKTLLHVVPISRLHKFAMDAKRVGLYARFAICVEVAPDRVGRPPAYGFFLP